MSRWRFALLVPALALLLSGCLPADEAGFGVAGPAAGDPADTDDPDLDDEAIDEDEDEDEEGLADWDSSPPDDLAEGSVLVWQINCGMLDGSGANIWEWDGDTWQGFEEGDQLPGVEDDFEGGSPYDEVKPCFRPTSNPTMEWDEDGSIRFFNGDWLHAMAPSPVEGRWLGTVSPMFEVSEECHTGMADVGLQIPVNLTIQAFELIDPLS